ncbi:L-serine ammonia-lyase [Lentzea sp. NPDC051838]|uniref:L-serine ammonia-lyase n=1 Tax=Lentzea sp. NPDC051838 TaxID=3154849 RepID=UPI00343FC59B
MKTSVFDLFSVGIGPSSSHTVGPMRAARMFALTLPPDVASVTVRLHGSLGATGLGHGSDTAVLLGLEGSRPEDVDIASIPARIARIHATGQVRLLGDRYVDACVVLDSRPLPEHPNGMVFEADGFSQKYFSVGGGFVKSSLDEVVDPLPVPHPFRSGADLIGACESAGLSIAELMRRNECAWRLESEVDAGLAEIWRVMQECVRWGCARDGVLPGGLNVPRRAKALLETLTDSAEPQDWVSLYALAVNEENASGGRVVTAPTNGAAGIVPAVLHYYTRFVNVDGVEDFLLTAGAIGVVLKETGSISGAEVGCQGEVGSACAMAAAGLCAVLGGTVRQIENAAEIGLEHHLGLTCDPIGGLVQIPCIERNAVAAVTAITAARLALRGDGTHLVHLDDAIATLRATGADMSDKYKETARGGLAVNVVEC